MAKDPTGGLGGGRITQPSGRSANPRDEEDAEQRRRQAAMRQQQLDDYFNRLLGATAKPTPTPTPTPTRTPTPTGGAGPTPAPVPTPTPTPTPAPPMPPATPSFTPPLAKVKDVFTVNPAQAAAARAEQSIKTFANPYVPPPSMAPRVAATPSAPQPAQTRANWWDKILEGMAIPPATAAPVQHTATPGVAQQMAAMARTAQGATPSWVAQQMAQRDAEAERLMKQRMLLDTQAALRNNQYTTGQPSDMFGPTTAPYTNAPAQAPAAVTPPTPAPVPSFMQNMMSGGPLNAVSQWLASGIAGRQLPPVTAPENIQNTMDIIGRYLEPALTGSTAFGGGAYPAPSYAPGPPLEVPNPRDEMRAPGVAGPVRSYGQVPGLLESIRDVFTGGEYPYAVANMGQGLERVPLPANVANYRPMNPGLNDYLAAMDTGAGPIPSGPTTAVPPNMPFLGQAGDAVRSFFANMFQPVQGTSNQLAQALNDASSALGGTLSNTSANLGQALSNTSAGIPLDQLSDNLRSGLNNTSRTLGGTLNRAAAAFPIDRVAEVVAPGVMPQTATVGGGGSSMLNLRMPTATAAQAVPTGPAVVPAQVGNFFKNMYDRLDAALAGTMTTPPAPPTSVQMGETAGSAIRQALVQAGVPLDQLMDIPRSGWRPQTIVNAVASAPAPVRDALGRVAEVVAPGAIQQALVQAGVPLEQLRDVARVLTGPAPGFDVGLRIGNELRGIDRTQDVQAPGSMPATPATPPATTAGSGASGAGGAEDAGQTDTSLWHANMSFQEVLDMIGRGLGTIGPALGTAANKVFPPDETSTFMQNMMSGGPLNTMGQWLASQIAGHSLPSLTDNARTALAMDQEREDQTTPPTTESKDEVWHANMSFPEVLDALAIGLGLKEAPPTAAVTPPTMGPGTLHPYDPAATTGTTHGRGPTTEQMNQAAIARMMRMYFPDASVQQMTDRELYDKFRKDIAGVLTAEDMMTRLKLPKAVADAYGKKGTTPATAEEPKAPAPAAGETAGGGGGTTGGGGGGTTGGGGGGAPAAAEPGLFSEEIPTWYRDAFTGAFGDFATFYTDEAGAPVNGGPEQALSDFHTFLTLWSVKTGRYPSVEEASRLFAEFRLYLGRLGRKARFEDLLNFINHYFGRSPAAPDISYLNLGEI